MSENFNNETNEEKSKSSPSFFNTILWILAIYGALLLIDKNVTKLSFFRSVNQKVTSLFKETPKKKEFDYQKDVENQKEVDFNKPMESTEEIAVADFSPETYQIYNSSEYIKVINPNDDQKNQILTFLETKNKVYDEGDECDSKLYCYYCSRSIRGSKRSYFKKVLDEFINNNSRTRMTRIAKERLNNEGALKPFDLSQLVLNEIDDFYKLINSDYDYLCVSQGKRSDYKDFCSDKCVDNYKINNNIR